MTNIPNGLMALIAHGASDVYLHGNPQISIFVPHYKRTSNSSFTFQESKFIDIEDDLIVEIPRKDLDLIGQCYLDIELHENTIDSIQNIYSIINEVSCIIENNTLEILLASTLEIIAASNKNYKAEFDDSNTANAIIPLPFFFTKKTNVYIPNFKESNMKIKCKLSDKSLVKKIKLIYQTIYLDTVERKYLIHDNFEYLITRTKTVNTTITIPENNISFKLDIGIYFDGYVKDLRILSRFGNINKLKLYLNGHLHMSISSLMAKKIIPKRFYNIQDYSDIYYMTFCHDPLASRIEQTSQINFHRLEKVELELFMDPGTYDISIMAQNYNILRTHAGHINIAY